MSTRAVHAAVGLTFRGRFVTVTPEWKRHLDATRLVRNKPDPRTGEVAVYRRLPNGDLRHVQTEASTKS